MCVIENMSLQRTDEPCIGGKCLTYLRGETDICEEVQLRMKMQVMHLESNVESEGEGWSNKINGGK